MDTNKMRNISRQQFDRWLNDSANTLLRAGETIAAQHLRKSRDILLFAWESSREAVVVVLPGKPCYRGYAAYDDAMADARTAIEAQGLKVKP